MTKISRRRFGGALGAATVFGLSAAALAQQPPAETAPGANKEEPPVPKEELSPEAEALAAFIVARYGAFLDEERRRVVRSDVSDMIGIGEALRAVPLTNADEPDATFRVIADPVNAGPAVGAPRRRSR